MKRTVNKLVRDNIPTIIKSKDKVPFCKSLNDKEFEDELFKKLFEEINEVIGARKDRAKLVSEIADVHEVLDYIQNIYHISSTQVTREKVLKAAKEGKFEKKVFLESVDE